MEQLGLIYVGENKNNVPPLKKGSLVAYHKGIHLSLKFYPSYLSQINEIPCL